MALGDVDEMVVERKEIFLSSKISGHLVPACVLLPHILLPPGSISGFAPILSHSQPHAHQHVTDMTFVDLLKHKSNPHHAASQISSWVDSERALRLKLAKEKALREAREKIRNLELQLETHKANARKAAAALLDA